MKKILSIFLAVALVGFVSTVSAQTIVGSKHDLSTSGTGSYQSGDRVCAFCHTPHQASSASGQYPLWNHSLSTHATYGVYSSSTLNASPQEIGAASMGSATATHLCLGCHDGTVALGSLLNQPNSGAPSDTTTVMTGDANVGTDLTNDHPVNFTYDSALATEDGELWDPSSGTMNAQLFSSRVQCATCHDVHDNTNSPFLTKSNTGSALCLTCHRK